MIENVAKALSEFIDERPLTEPLARSLILFLDEQIVSADSLKSALGRNYLDVLLLAFEWRMLLPFSATKTCAWEDRLLVSVQATQYEIPKAVLYVVREAASQGKWLVEDGLTKLFHDAETTLFPEKMFSLFLLIIQRSRFKTVSGRDIVSCCRAMDLPNMADQTIAVFKGLGIISPKLSSVGSLSLSSGPLYEVNPSLCVLPVPAN